MLNLKDGTLWQWDTGRKILVTLQKGHTIDKVQFYNGIGDSARTGKLETDSNGNLLAIIPDVLLQYHKNLSVYLMTTDEDGLKTTETIVLKVNQRAKPENYVFTDDEILTYRIYDERLQAVEEDAAQIHSDINYLDAELTDEINTVSTKTDLAMTIAKGANKALAYESYEAMISIGSTFFPSLLNMPIGELNRGQNIYIGTVGVPDLWIYSCEEERVEYEYVDDETFVNEINSKGIIQVGYYKLARLETQEVDLSGVSVEMTDVIIPILNTDWVLDEATGYYYQVFEISGITEDVNPLIGLVSTNTPTYEWEAEEYSHIVEAVTTKDHITFYADRALTATVTVIIKGISATNLSTAAQVANLVSAYNELNESLNVEVISLATNAVLIRFRNIRILQLSETTYSTIKNYKLEETDAPTSTIYSSGFRTTDVGAYITIAEIVVRDGAISCYCADHYNNSEMGLAELGETNKITGNIVWVV